MQSLHLMLQYMYNVNTKVKVMPYLEPDESPMRGLYFRFVWRRFVTVVQYTHHLKLHLSNMAQHQFLDIDGSVLEGVRISRCFFNDYSNANTGFGSHE